MPSITNKLLLSAALAACLPLTALAQPAAPAKADAKPPAKAPAKPAAKPAANSGEKTAAKKPPAKKQISRSAAKAVEEVTPVDDDPNLVLTPAALEIAQRVFTGKIQCELGADVTVTADEKKPGFFTVSTKGVRYRMHPVESRTGAIRLEDPRAEALWLQLGNKSMLMNQKQGLRLADDCMAPTQQAMADDMKKNPPKALFEGADAPNQNAAPYQPEPAAPAKKSAQSKK